MPSLVILTILVTLLTPGQTILIKNRIVPLEIPNATITAYSEIDSCHYENCLTASGKRAYIGGAACPREIPLGVKFIVAGEVFTCEDRYNKDLSFRFDLFFGYGEENHKEALRFGKQKDTAYLFL